MKVNERYSKRVQTYMKVGKTHMNYYTKQLFHSSTADVEKRKGLQRNYISALTDEENYDDKLDKQKTAITDKQREQQKNNNIVRRGCMYQKNKLWKDHLMHKSIVEKREIEKVLTEKTTTPIEADVRRMEEREALAKEASKNRSASKKLANNDWYERNKQWKKEYNAEYYQNNKDYWKKYYEYQRDATNYRARMAKERRDEANEALRKYGADSKEYKRLDSSASTNEEWLRRDQGKLNAASLNYRKAQEEFNWATTTFAKTPISKIMSSGYNSIVSAGKSFIYNFKSGLNTLSSAISRGFSKLKSLFS